MDYLFFLNEFSADEPIGWQDFELSLKRDDKTHGMQFEASTGSLRFYGSSAQFLIDQKNQYGIKANVVFTAQEFCNDPYTPFEEITGRLNFGKFRSTCGAQCVVEIPLEEEGCKVVFKSRYDHKVDMDLLTGSDGMTPLTYYPALDLRLPMPAKAVEARTEGYVAEGGNSEFDQQTAGGTKRHLVRPSYEDIRFNSIPTGQLVGVSTTNFPTPVTPQLLFEGEVDCYAGPYEYDVRLKGFYSASTVASGTVNYVHAILVTWDGVGDIWTDSTTIASQVISGSPQSIPLQIDFDAAFSGSVPLLEEGIGVYALIKAETQTTTGGTGDVFFSVNFDEDTFFSISTIKICPPTVSDAYLVHETLSRIAESITNDCIRVQSNYYGRTDSQPFSFDHDGCGSLRMLTSGLKIRNAPEGKFFASMKDIYEGLNPIDNIGFDIVDDPDIPNHYIMRVEDVGFFYQDEEIFVIDHVPRSQLDVQEPMHYSKINVGYEKWEVENVNGLDEFNSTREYRTSLDTVSNTLEIKSKLIAGPYAYEVTRQQNFAESGKADTKFDNDIFILTLARTAYSFEVEQGNVENASGFFSPETIINAELSPVRNLMRWYKTIAAGYASLSDSQNDLSFNAGTGNFTAVMETTEGAYEEQCKPEALPIAENQDIFVTHFARPEDYTPLWKNEIETFEYPLNIAEYKAIKVLPYGYISYRCGSDMEFKKGFIWEIKFKPARGLATFSLLAKWE